VDGGVTLTRDAHWLKGGSRDSGNFQERGRRAGFFGAMLMARILERLNGWERLWLVGTVCLGLWFMGWMPLENANEAGGYVYSERAKLKIAFENPQCELYRTAPLDTLHQRPAEEGCTHLYSARVRADEANTPFSLEAALKDLDRQASASWWSHFNASFGFGFIGTALLSAFVYFCGWIVGWIYRGFRRA
jgi:hypothetical protein